MRLCTATFIQSFFNPFMIHETVAWHLTPLGCSAAQASHLYGARGGFQHPPGLQPCPQSRGSGRSADDRWSLMRPWPTGAWVTCSCWDCRQGAVSRTCCCPARARQTDVGGNGRLWQNSSGVRGHCLGLWLFLWCHLSFKTKHGVRQSQTNTGFIHLNGKSVSSDQKS